MYVSAGSGAGTALLEVAAQLEARLVAQIQRRMRTMEDYTALMRLKYVPVKLCITTVYTISMCSNLIYYNHATYS